jgi:hypothetical protein
MRTIRSHTRSLRVQTLALRMPDCLLVAAVLSSCQGLQTDSDITLLIARYGAPPVVQVLLLRHGTAERTERGVTTCRVAEVVK